MEQIRLDHEWKCREVTEKFEIQRREAIRQVNEVERLTLSDLQHQYHAERDAALLRHSEKLGFARQKYAIPDHISETAEDGGTSPSTTLATYSSRPNVGFVPNPHPLNITWLKEKLGLTLIPDGGYRTNQQCYHSTY